MNREIKFRGKRVDNGQWVYGMLYQYQGKLTIGNEIIEPPTHSDPAGTWIYNEYLVIPETVGQYTGLKDKDGNEIYEGDQLYICAGYSCVVEFQDGMFVGVYSHFEDGEIVPLHEHNTTKCQIIHDNPELIK